MHSGGAGGTQFLRANFVPNIFPIQFVARTDFVHLWNVRRISFARIPPCERQPFYCAKDRKYKRSREIRIERPIGLLRGLVQCPANIADEPR